jgi:hypothetical protein
MIIQSMTSSSQVSALKVLALLNSERLVRTRGYVVGPGLHPHYWASPNSPFKSVVIKGFTHKSLPHLLDGTGLDN